MRHSRRFALVPALFGALMAGLLAAVARPLPAAELNEVSQAELERIKGIGPELSDRILAQRAHRRFDGWADLMKRVPGVGRRSAERLAAQGLSVAGQSYAPTPAASSASADSAR
jgi:competence protein ComEA